MRQLLIAAILCLFAVPALAQGGSNMCQYPPVSTPVAPSACWPVNVNGITKTMTAQQFFKNAVQGPSSSVNGDAAVWVGTTGTQLADLGSPPQIVAYSVAGLKAIPANPGTQVQVNGYYTAGDAPSVVYTMSSSPCPLNAGGGDNGAQIKPASGSGCWLLAPQTAYDIRTWGAVAGGTDPNNNNAALINNAETYCASISGTGTNLHAIKITGSMQSYGVNAPVQLKCENQLFGEMTLLALSATSIPCITDAVVEVLAPSFVATLRDLTVNSNFLPVNGVANETNGKVHLENLLVDRWQGSCGNVTVTGSSASTYSRTIVVGSSASLSIGMVSRGNANVGGSGSGVLDRSIIVGIIDSTHIFVDKPVSGSGFSGASLTFYNDSNGIIFGLNATNAGGSISNSQINEYENSDTTACGGGNCKTLNAYRYGAALVQMAPSNDVSINVTEFDLGIVNELMLGGTGMQNHAVEFNAGSFSTNAEPYVSNVIVAQGSSNFQLNDSGNNGGAISYFTLDNSNPALRVTNTRFQGSASVPLTPPYWIQFCANQSSVSQMNIIVDPSFLQAGSSYGTYTIQPVGCPGTWASFGPVAQANLSTNNGALQRHITLRGTGNYSFSGLAISGLSIISNIANGTGCSGASAPYSCMTLGDAVTIGAQTGYIRDWDPVAGTVSVNFPLSASGAASGAAVPCNHYFLPQDSYSQFFIDAAGVVCTPNVTTLLPNGWQLGGLYAADSVGGGSVTLTAGTSANINNASTFALTLHQFYQGAVIGSAPTVLGIH